MDLSTIEKKIDAKEYKGLKEVYMHVYSKEIAETMLLCSFPTAVHKLCALSSFIIRIFRDSDEYLW